MVFRWFKDKAERISESSAAIFNVRWALKKELEDRDFDITYDFKGWLSILDAVVKQLEEISADIESESDFLNNPENLEKFINHSGQERKGEWRFVRHMTPPPETMTPSPEPSRAQPS